MTRIINIEVYCDLNEYFCLFDDNDDAVIIPRKEHGNVMTE